MVLSNVKSLLQYLEHDSNLERRISEYQGNKDTSTSQGMGLFWFRSGLGAFIQAGECDNVIMVV